MGNLGTIIDENGPGGRLPATPAVGLGDKVPWGVAVSAIGYYDAMDNGRLASASAGGWGVVGRLRLKAAIEHFDALGIYREQTGYLSCAITLPRSLCIGAQFTGSAMSLATSNMPRRTLGEGGFSLRLPFRLIVLNASCDRITVKSTGVEGADVSPRLRFGIHTTENVFGAQGVRIDITPAMTHPVSIAIGQEFRFSKRVALHGAVANNPLQVAVGCVVFWGENGGCLSAALVNHPVLGWSRGFGAQHGWGGRQGAKKS